MFGDDIVRAYGEQIAQEHRMSYNTDIDGAQFKMGQMVKLHLSSTKKYITNLTMGRVTSVNETDEGTFEYTVEGVPFLLWEHELEEISQ